MVRKRGFTLIELMIAMAIIAILISVAIPNYNRYIMRAHRTDGIVALKNVMDAQEQYFADSRSYTKELTVLGFASDTIDSPNKKYKITAKECGTMPLTQCIKLIATGQGNQAKDGELIMDSNGSRERLLNGVTERW